MNSIDWQAYLEKILDPSEMDRIHQELQRNPELQNELRAFQKYRTVMADARVSEHVPLAKLESIFTTVTLIKPQKPRWIWVAAATIVISCAAFAAFQAFRVQDPETGPVVQQFMGSATGNWVNATRDASGMKVSSLELPKDVKICRVEIGSHWTRLHLSDPGGSLVLHIRPIESSLNERPLILDHGHPFRQLDDGLTWSNCNYVLVLKGRRYDRLYDLANQLAKQTDKWH